MKVKVISRMISKNKKSTLKIILISITIILTIGIIIILVNKEYVEKIQKMI